MQDEYIGLRALEPTDADTIFGWENDPNTWETGNQKWPVSLNDVKSLIAHSDLDIWQTRQVRYMIDNKSHETVGCVDIYDFDPMNKNCHVGIYVSPEYRHKGYATHAVTLTEAFAFETLDITNIVATVAANNSCSIALFRKLGYLHAGTLKKWIRFADHYTDQLIYQKSRP